MPHKIQASAAGRRGIVVRVELSEREQLHEAARRERMSLQAYVRKQIGLPPYEPKYLRKAERPRSAPLDPGPPAMPAATEPPTLSSLAGVWKDEPPVDLRELRGGDRD